ncbi:hypothetical protein BKA82DRAFT_4240913 [Pisolithus tinctorius]|nr:hypothetical protein BKA82DRAFT_4240913 [Pisolithus tinctorius]
MTVDRVSSRRLTYKYSNQLSFNEGDVLTIVDRVESDWWRAERDGVVYAVPAAYVEVAEG